MPVSGEEKQSPWIAKCVETGDMINVLYETWNKKNNRRTWYN